MRRVNRDARAGHSGTYDDDVKCLILETLDG